VQLRRAKIASPSCYRGCSRLHAQVREDVRARLGPQMESMDHAEVATGAAHAQTALWGVDHAVKRAACALSERGGARAGAPPSTAGYGRT
jgi:hypothetical protein